MHIQGEREDKGKYPKRKITDPNDASQLPKSLQGNEELRGLIRRAFEHLEKARKIL